VFVSCLSQAKNIFLKATLYTIGSPELKGRHGEEPCDVLKLFDWLALEWLVDAVGNGASREKELFNKHSHTLEKGSPSVRADFILFLSS